MLKKAIGRVFWLLFGSTVTLMLLLIQPGSVPQLNSWHDEDLSREFTAKQLDTIKTFDDYRQMENRLFEELEEKVYLPANSGKGRELVRYSLGSLADPRVRQPNWNRSFELTSASPGGGILLLHGMSDSPYSLRALGEAFNSKGYWVVGLRLPGHGTAPSGLTTVQWQDMAAAVRLGINHLVSKVGQKPVHLVGYSTGASLALDFTIEALEGRASPVPASLVLISPAIGISPAAGLAGIKDRFSRFPGLAHLAWLSVQPEFDPYKYNSFATNAGTQVHRITRSVARSIDSWTHNSSSKDFPPILVFKSTVDATVSVDAVVDNLLKPLINKNNELVLFDINRFAANSSLLIDDPGPLTARLMADKSLPFVLTLIGNVDRMSREVIARRKHRFATGPPETTYLGMSWPQGVVSLSHVALPFPPDDPLYGLQPPEDKGSLYLGQMAIKGERGLLKIPDDALLRLRCNPFYKYLENRALDWVEEANGR